MQTIETCVEHKLEFRDCSNGEALYECRECPYYEFKYEDCLGG
jgi:hypothetical protein